MRPLASGIALALALVAGLVAGTAAGDEPIFVDVTDEVGLDFVHWNGRTGELYFAEMMGGGGALFDYDRDGDLDLWIVQGQLLNPKKTVADAVVAPPAKPPLTDRLFRNDSIRGGKNGGERGPLRFVDVTEEAGIDARGYGMGATAGDFDGDGWTDVYVTNFGANELWRNRGPGPDGRITFENVTAKAGMKASGKGADLGDPSWSVPALFADFDGDGRLDLYVGNYLDFRLGNHKTCFGASGAPDYCGPASYQPEPDRLFRNRGDGTFEDVTASAGLGRAIGAALGAVTGDFDGDGRLDLYVANDEMANHLWVHPSGAKGFRLEDTALLAGAAVNADGLAESSMGVDAGDIDGDGDEDLFLSHLTGQTNTLYRNDGQGFFEDATAVVGLGVPSWPFTGFGTKLFDYDNDGWLDVIVANGAIRTLEELARAGDPFPLHQADQLFRNRGDGTFEDVTARAGEVFRVSAVGRGLAVGDLDNDGDTDVVLFDNGGPARVLRNEIGSKRPWIGVEAWDAKLDRPAIGARVGVTVGEGENSRTTWRRVRRDGGYTSANDPRVLFGLGEAPGEAGVTVRVEWPAGTGGPNVEEWSGLAPGRYHRLVAGEGRAPNEP